MLQEFPFSSLPQLAHVDLSVNELYGIIPPQIGHLSKLIYLDLQINLLSGKIPPEIGLLTNLTTLHLSENKLNGSIPRDMCQLRLLEELALHMNRLDDSIPSCLGNLTNLFWLSLYNNSLSGSIPREIGKLSNLVELDLDTNHLTGSIPSTLGYLKKLTVLHIFDNQLSGPIPEEIGNLESLWDLSLKTNNLSGPIPASLGHLGNIEFLHLYQNQLSGSIPEDLGNLSSLVDLELSENQLNVVLFCGLIIMLFSFRTRKRGSVTGSNMNNEELLSISIFDGKTMLREIIEATKNFDSLYCIGEGRFGRVYKAELLSGDTVAVKKFHSLPHDEMADQKEFLNEIRVLTEVKHRNVVKLYGFCSHVRHTFLVYEYLPRGSLATILCNDEAAKEFGWDKRLTVIKGAAYACTTCTMSANHQLFIETYQARMFCWTQNMKLMFRILAQLSFST
ncbi:hypothetical protein GH714_004103 [Hevea brasiliensis]|uniref:non-specific serine/threonine protein kinase n=1 Tax=Hevea brasiliensis TaxID=3981 RepID=A0A6A6KPN4_HEVBR|nr:hypothetical protein GH714_004103 [Hevea brasiliensis]